MKQKRFQTSLELAVVLASITLFFIGVTRIWVWSNAQVVGRTPGYRASRLEAGSTNPGFWGDTNEGVYTPKELTEAWVFSGDAAPGAGGNINYPGSPTGGLSFYGHSYTDEQLGMAGGGNIFNFNIDIDDYDLTGYDCSDLATLESQLITQRQDVLDQRPPIQTERDKWNSYLLQAQYEVSRLSGGAVNITCANYRSYCTQCGCTCTSPVGWGSCDYDELTCVRGCTIFLNAQIRDGYMEVPFNCWYGAGGNEDCCSGIAIGSPCFSGCSACGWASCCSQCFTITSPYTSRAQMAQDYYYYKLITSDFTLDITARQWLYTNDPKYKFFDNPYGSYCNCWGSSTGCNKGTYHPGLLDWQAREAYAQTQYDQYQGALDDIDNAIATIDAILADIATMKSDLGC